MLVAVLLLQGCKAPADHTDHANHTDLPLVRSQAWRMGASAAETLQAVETATDWQPLNGWKTWGFGDEAVWVRVVLRAQTVPSAQPWVLRVRPAFLDYVTLYDPATGQVQRSGDALPPTEASLASINLTFLVPALPVERTVYLQLRTDSARALLVDVLPYEVADTQNRLFEWLVGLVVTLSGVLGIGAIVAWRTTGQRLLGVFAIKQGVAVLWGFFIFGFARVTIGTALPEGVLTTLSSTVFIWVVGVSLWFLVSLIQSHQPHRMALRACQVLAVVLACLPVLQCFGLTRAMLFLGNAAIPLGLMLLFVGLLKASSRRQLQPLSRPFLLFYLSVYGVLNSMPPLVHMGLIEGHSVLLFASLVHAVLDGLVMFVMLQIRSRVLHRRHQKTLQKLARSQVRTAANKRHREEQRELLAMLAHELRTPLATLRMWTEAGTPQRAPLEQTIADMSQVIERCVHTEQLAEQGLKPDFESVPALDVTRSCVAACRAPERVDVRAATGPVRLRTDAQMLAIALSNLLDNACRYGEPHGRIQVRLRPAQQAGRSGWRWEVANAPGLAGRPDAERVFEKYYRSPAARRLSGSGLGLFVVKGLLDLLQGSVGYEADQPWVVFSLWLPQDPQPG